MSNIEGNPNDTATANGNLGISSDQSSDSDRAGTSGRNGDGNATGDGLSGNPKQRARSGSNSRKSTGAEKSVVVESDLLETEKEPSLFGENFEPKVVPIIKVTGSKRGRKPGSKTTKVDSVEIALNEKDISQMLEWLFRIPTFYGKGKHWELSPNEIKELTEKTRAVLDQFPDLLIEKYAATTAKWLAPISLIISVLTLAWSRYQTDLIIEKYAISNKPNAESATGANGTAQQSETINSEPFTTSNGSWQGTNTGNGQADGTQLFGRII